MKVTDEIRRFVISYYQELGESIKKTHKSIIIAKEIADRFGVVVTDQTVRNILNKDRSDYITNTELNEEEVILGSKTGKDEWKPKIIERNDGFYEITNGKNRIIVISKDKVAKFKELYCGPENLNLNQVSRRLDIPRRDLHLVKTAFDITHDDTPFLDEELDGNIEDLVDISLEKKKELYFIKLQEKEIEKLKKEVLMYRKRDYFFEKVMQQMDIPERPLTFEPITVDSDIEAQINFADWHTGLKTESYWNSYSLEIQRQRLSQFVSEAKEILIKNNVRKLHVMNLGDLLHGLIHVSTRVVAECDVISQLRVTWKLLADILEAFSEVVEEVLFYSTYGNHSRLTENKQDALDRENLEYLIPDFLKAELKGIPNIKFVINEYDEQIIVANIAGHTIYAVHGDRDKPHKVAQDLTMMLNKKPYRIFSAHIHHKEVLEIHKVTVIVSKSLCGVDEYSKDIRCTSEAGQSLYIYSPKRLEATYDITF